MIKLSAKIKNSINTKLLKDFGREYFNKIPLQQVFTLLKENNIQVIPHGLYTGMV